MKGLPYWGHFPQDRLERKRRNKSIWLKGPGAPHPRGLRAYILQGLECSSPTGRQGERPEWKRGLSCKGTGRAHSPSVSGAASREGPPARGGFRETATLLTAGLPDIWECRRCQGSLPSGPSTGSSSSSAPHPGLAPPSPPDCFLPAPLMIHGPDLGL